MTSTLTAMTPQTLAQCLSEGRIPVADALRYSMILAESLRKLHEGGRAHGAVSPATINLTATGLELLPAPPIDDATSYKSPEVLDGLPADTRSDIFSFGAVVFEMLSGKRAFEGADRSAMAHSGSPAVDRLVGSCVVTDPNARIQRIQKVMLDLKLLAVSAARAAASSTPRRDPLAELEQAEARLSARLQATEKALAEAQAAATAGTRNEVVQLEARLAGRLQAGEKVVADIQVAVTEFINRKPEPLPDFALNTDLAHLEASVAGRLEQIEQHLVGALDRIERLEKVEHPVFDASPLEASVEQIRGQVTELHDLVAEDFLSFERSLQAQSTAIDSARTAMAQTDDLVERVVEALESLQSTVLENSEERALAIN